MSNINRIYQGRIINAEFEDDVLRQNAQYSPYDAIYDTHRLFQDAVNYHIVALAGMCQGKAVPIASEFEARIKSIWTSKPKNAILAETLQQSIARTLNLTAPTYEVAIDAIYQDIEHRELLPFVLKYIMDSTLSGDGAIQQNGRELLPKLCNPLFSGNFAFSRKERKSIQGLTKLKNRLEIANDDELKELALEMDLSWAGVKTQPDTYYTIEDSATEVSKAVNDLLNLLSKGLDAALTSLQTHYDADLCEMIRTITANGTIVPMKPLAKNNKAVPILKYCAILFMYYPCRLTADLLRIRLPKQKIESEPNDEWDIYSHLNDDPIILTRGKRGYVYKGFSALPCWDAESDCMYEKEWDILAFKEALKTIHGFDLKQKEREKKRKEIEQNIRYVTEGIGKPVDTNDENDAPLPVFKDDPRYNAVIALIKELTQKEEEPYTITSRTLNAFEDVTKAWKASINAGCDKTEDLQQCVKSVQAKSKHFGSQVLFDTLCKPEYRCIWELPAPCDKYPRSENILIDYGMLQSWNKELVHLSEPVRVTAAEARYSPRQLMYSDLANLGEHVKKGCTFIDREKGLIRLGVLVRNEKGRWKGTPVRVTYSAPRFVRDQIGESSEFWPKEKLPLRKEWMQPMLQALKLPPESMPIMDKTPAVGLTMADTSDGNGMPRMYLNFPTRLNVEPLQKELGKSELWQRQFCGGKDELLHLLWPALQKKANVAWWENENIQKSGFSILSVDLGVRYAAAYSLVRVSTRDNIKSLSGRDVVNRCIGCTGTHSWFAAVTRQGLIKLHGEGRSTGINRKEKHGPREVHGIRMAHNEERQTIIDAFAGVGATPWFANKKEDQLSILQLNDEALRLFRRILSRSRLFASWVYKLTLAEKAADTLQDMKNYFSKVGDDFYPDIRQAVESGGVSTAEKKLWTAAETLRKQLPILAEVVTNSVLPQQRYKWSWQPTSRHGFIGSGVMVRETDAKQQKVKRYFMGGLSVYRLTQLEELRHSLQSMNRQLHNKLGQEVGFGADTRNQPVIDPCPEILDKIGSLREERVHQIAHNIVAQALGVRLCETKDKATLDETGRDIYHGSYEVIPGRKPVDFVVLENLNKYRTGIDRAPDENTTLMRWAHRQILAKVKQLLTEVFGIPVLETHAAYTSKIDYTDSTPGFRAQQLTLSYCRRMEGLAKTEKERKTAIAYTGILKLLEAENVVKKLHLYCPRQGGEFFISQHNSKSISVRNADMNASANIAWRALAAPERLELIHRLRLNKTAKGELKLQLINSREKSLKDKELVRTAPEQVEKSGLITAFYGEPPYGPPLCYLQDDSSLIPFTYSKHVWGYIKNQAWDICHRLNIRLLENMGYNADSIKQLLESSCPDGDDIPM